MVEFITVQYDNRHSHTTVYRETLTSSPPTKLNQGVFIFAINWETLTSTRNCRCPVTTQIFLSPPAEIQTSNHTTIRQLIRCCISHITLHSHDVDSLVCVPTWVGIFLEQIFWLVIATKKHMKVITLVSKELIVMYWAERIVDEFSKLHVIICAYWQLSVSQHNQFSCILIWDTLILLKTQSTVSPDWLITTAPDGMNSKSTVCQLSNELTILIINHQYFRKEQKSMFSDSSFWQVNTIWFLYSFTLAVNWKSLDWRQNKTIEDVIWGFRKHLSTFFSIFCHFNDQTSNRFLKKKIKRWMANENSCYVQPYSAKLKITSVRWWLEGRGVFCTGLLHSKWQLTVRGNY